MSWINLFWNAGQQAQIGELKSADALANKAAEEALGPDQDPLGRGKQIHRIVRRAERLLDAHRPAARVRIEHAGAAEEAVAAYEAALSGGGIQVTGSYPGKARTLAELRQRHAALYLGIGAQAGRGLGIPGEDGPGVWTGTEFLEQVNRGETIEVRADILIENLAQPWLPAPTTPIRPMRSSSICSSMVRSAARACWKMR